MEKLVWNSGVKSKSPVRKFVAFFLFCTFFISACATRGHDMTKQLLEGNDAALQGDYATAVSAYENALKKVPNSIITRRNLGIVLVKVGNYKRARHYLESILPRYENDVEVRYFLGEASRGLADYSAALAQYQKALAIQPKDLRVIKAYAWTYNKIGNNERALAIVEPMLGSHSNDLQIRLIAAHSYLKLKKYKDAVSILAVIEKSGFKLQSKDKVSAEAEKILILSALGDAYLGLENCEKASSLYNEVLKTRPLLSAALTGLAKCDMKSNQKERAVAKLERAAKADPESPEAHYLLAKLLENSDAKKSASYYRKFLILARDNNDFSEETESSKNALSNLEKPTRRSSSSSSRKSR